MRQIFLFLIFYLLSQLSLSSQDTMDASGAHVILIVVDDMGWNDVGYHGSEIQTPTIDRLASEGLELNRFYSNSACTPTRSSLMKGKTAARLGC
ncbi:MAG: sulfatase-like hydrolase/transferase, partial [Bacteroidota bacterium]